MKKVECRRCSRGLFCCPTGEHTKQPGKIHSGRGARMDAYWDCPTCDGRGFVLVSFIDSILLSIYLRMRRINSMVNPR